MAAVVSDASTHNLDTTINFVKNAAAKFGWEDLTNNSVMDIGCGRGLYCARTVLENFPKVKIIIVLDADPDELEEISFKSPKIIPVLADILKWNDFREWEGKIDKAISTHVIHQIPHKEVVFKNIYRLLKPGGQAAFLFTSDLNVYHALEHLRLDAKYKAYYKGADVMDFYSRQLKAHHYEEMLKDTGFKVIEISEEKEYIPFDFYVHFERIIHKTVNKTFSMPSELVKEMQESASNFFKAKFCEKQSIFTGTEMTILVTKPVDSTTGCSSF